MDIDLSTELAGVRLKNPIIVSSGPHGRDGKTIKKISNYGPSAIVTKTIVGPKPAPNPLPCLAKVNRGLLNCSLASGISAERWFKQEFKIAKQGKAKVVANLMGPTPKKTAELAINAQNSGADFIEIGVPGACPHSPEILTAMFPDRQYSKTTSNNPEWMLEMLKAVKEVVDVPVIVKLGHVVPAIEFAKAAEKNGANAISASDSWGPALAIDIRNGQPLLGGPRGVGGFSGLPIKPLALRIVLDIAQNVEIPVVGIGGVFTWRDAVEYFMAGAKCVQLCTAGSIEGPKVYSRIIKGLKNWLIERNLCNFEEIIGLTLKKIEQRKNEKKQIILTPIPPLVDKDKCNACKLCENCCVYGAIEVKDIAEVDDEKCYGCGLCATVCPRAAITLRYYH
jgi:dihydroorotate dehydrogenase (NAD+) catalytic subunit